jgi:hypothetical protein
VGVLGAYGFGPLAQARGFKEWTHIPAYDVDPDYKGKGLQLEFTVEDEGVFTMPWKGMVTYRPPGAGVRTAHGLHQMSDVRPKLAGVMQRQRATDRQRHADRALGRELSRQAHARG